MIDDRTLDQACGLNSDIPRLFRHANFLGVAGSALALAAVGTAVSAVGAIRQGQAAQNEADFNSEIASRKATRETDNAKIRSRDFARTASATQSDNLAQSLGSGGGEFSGSAVDVTNDFEAEKELNIQRLLNQGEVSANNLQAESNLFKQAGKNAKSASQIKAGSTIISGISSFGTGFASAKKQWLFN